MQEQVDRLKSEVTGLKLEIATLTSALRDLQCQQTGRALPAKPIAIEPPSRPSMTPAAIVVLIASGLLSWQVIATPRADRTSAEAVLPATVSPVIDRLEPVAVPVVEEMGAAAAQTIRPPVTPTIYKGTLSVKADRPDAQVFVNGRNVGTAPVRIGNLRAGAHLVRVERDGYRRWTRVVTVPAETVTRVAADLEPDPVVEP